MEMPADTSTSVLAAEALGTTVGAIVKSILLLSDGKPVLVLAPGDRRVSKDRLCELTGSMMVRLAKPDEVLAITGYQVGGVPPLAHGSVLPILMDRRLLDQGVVYAAAGASNAIFAVEPDLLRRITAAKVVDVTL